MKFQAKPGNVEYALTDVFLLELVVSSNRDALEFASCSSTYLHRVSPILSIVALNYCIHESIVF